MSHDEAHTYTNYRLSYFTSHRVRACLSVCLSVCVLVSLVRSAKTAKPIEMSFERRRVDPRLSEHVAPPGEYDWRFRTRRRRGL